MKLDEILRLAGWTEDSVTRLYVGKSHACRCGCCGDYFDRGTPEFEEAMQKLRDGVELVHDFGPDDLGPNYVNVDTDEDEDTCICLYND